MIGDHNSVFRMLPGVFAVTNEYFTFLKIACLYWYSPIGNSGGFRNLERVVQPLAHNVHPKICGLPPPTFGHMKVRTEYLEATLGLVKCLEISKRLIRATAA